MSFQLSLLEDKISKVSFFNDLTITDADSAGVDLEIITHDAFNY
ncbi:MAG: hypothetical protein NTZ94_05500 [Verrucomicrobia bacterium]|nr:hypothetical protein [Verrucomicrobiota bacterium]